MSYSEQLADFSIIVPLQMVQRGVRFLVPVNKVDTAAAGLNSTPARELQRSRLLYGKW
jgi:hypothetical protein